MVQPPSEAEHLRDNVEAVRVEAVTMNELRDGDVALCGESGKQVETLENEADFAAAEFGARGVAQLREIIAVDQDFAARRLRQAADDIEEGRFAAARRAHDSHGFSGQDFEIHAAQGWHFHFARAVKLP